MKLWIVMLHVEPSPDNPTGLEIVGAFSSEEKAVAVCKGPNYFVGPLTLDEEIPDTQVWPGAYYPIRAEGGQ